MFKRILRWPSVKEISGLGKSAMYDRIADGLWIKPVSLGGRAVGWPDNEVATLIAARIAGKSDDEIRALVQQLERNRSSLSSEIVPHELPSKGHRKPCFTRTSADQHPESHHGISESLSHNQTTSLHGIKKLPSKSKPRAI